MARTKMSCAFYAFLVIAIFTIGFNIVGFASDRLVVLNRKFTVEEIQLTTEKIIQQAFLMEEVDTEESSDGDSRQMIDEGGVHAPEDVEDVEDEDKPHHPHPPPHHGGHRRHHHHHHHGVIEETTQIQEWLKETVVEIEHVQITLRFGVWHSKLCMHAKMESMGDDDDMNKHDDDDSSSSSEEGHKKKCSCKKLSTKCALALSTMFLDMNEIYEIEAEEKKPFYKFNSNNFIGNTCLTEHRVEITIGFVLLMVAAVVGIVAMKKMTSCRAITCLICLLVASIMMLIPVGRILRYNMVEVRSKMTTSDMHFPHALLALLLSACGTLILAIIVAVAARRQRKSMPGKWNTLENEAESFSEKKNGMPPSLVFIPEPLTGKSGLYDIWGDVKPVEYMEPEKKPLE